MNLKQKSFSRKANQRASSLGRFPFRNKHTTASLIERCTIGCRHAFNTATLIGTLIRRINVTIHSRSTVQIRVPLSTEQRAIIRCHRATVVSMQRRENLFLRVDAFHNVDFAKIGPTVQTGGPERWPRTATGRHMVDVECKQSSSEKLLAEHSNGFSSVLCDST
jgi:hypothetical protein